MLVYCGCKCTVFLMFALHNYLYVIDKIYFVCTGLKAILTTFQNIHLLWNTASDITGVLCLKVYVNTNWERHLNITVTVNTSILVMITVVTSPCTWRTLAQSGFITTALQIIYLNRSIALTEICTLEISNVTERKQQISHS